MAEFVKVATTSDIEPGTVKVYEAGGKQIAVCNVDGTFYAIDDVCTHDGGELGEGTLRGDRLICPRHGAAFDARTGRVLTLPAVHDVRSYPVTVESDDVFVACEDGAS